VLLVNGEPIMRSTVEKLLEPLKKAGISQQQFMQYQQRLVQNMITDMLIDQFLREEGFVPTREEIATQVKRRERIYNEDANQLSFEETLKRSGTSMAEMMATPDPRLRFSCYVRRRLEEKDIQRAYETDKDSWAKVRARHILITTRGLKTEEEKAAARRKTEDIRMRVLSGEDFAKLAQEFSACGSKQTGGDLGFFARHGKMVEPFAKAAFELDVNGVSPLVESDFGFHVIQVTETRKGDAPLEEVREYVADAAAERLGQDLFGKMQGRAKIEVPGQPGPPAGAGATPAPK